MKTYEYESYDEYVAIQTDANKRKLKRDHSFVSKRTVDLIARVHGDAQNIICHGTRGGNEQRLFKTLYPTANIIGTEISDTASKFPNTVQHDFHKQKDEWINNFDIVYSNSWDHSFDHIESITTWRDQLNETGRIYLDHAYNELNNVSSAVDPLEIYHNEIIELIESHNMFLEGTHKTSGGGDGKKPCRLYVIGRNSG